MQILLVSILMLCVPLHSNCMRQCGYGMRYMPMQETHERHLMIHEEKIREELIAMGNGYNLIGFDIDKPLTVERVLTPFWASLRDKPREEKNAALRRILDIAFPGTMMGVLVSNLAGAAFADADMNTQGSLSTPLENAVIHDYVALARLLCQCGASPAKNYNASFGPLLFRAKSLAMAELLCGYGASIFEMDYEGNTLLHKSMEGLIDVDVVGFCLQRGLHPFMQNEHDDTPLHVLAKNVLENCSGLAVKKAQLLCEGLCASEVRSLCFVQNKRGKTPLDILRDSIKERTADTNKAQKQNNMLPVFLGMPLSTTIHRSALNLLEFLKREMTEPSSVVTHTK